MTNGTPRQGGAGASQLWVRPLNVLLRAQARGGALRFSSPSGRVMPSSFWGTLPPAIPGHPRVSLPVSSVRGPARDGRPAVVGPQAEGRNNATRVIRARAGWMQRRVARSAAAFGRKSPGRARATCAIAWSAQTMRHRESVCSWTLLPRTRDVFLILMFLAPVAFSSAISSESFADSSPD